ncbi:MAG TPA: NTP transferase domain-containing protein [Desulfobacteria bacterium]|nr:NTP transferase domain-containing protein [Desulfobacteria bacterium]
MGLHFLSFLHIMETDDKTASIIMAAGRGSRMKDYGGNKTLLPLIPEDSPYSGKQPILLHIIENLPPGPKAVVVHHRKEDIQAATRQLHITYATQPVLNGTGGALLAARPFMEKQECKNLLITMGDVPFIARKTCVSLLEALKFHDLVVLGFMPEDKKQYGVLEIEGRQVHRIVEWKYWKNFPTEDQKRLKICNSGIYAAKKDRLLQTLRVLAARPHVVQKEVDGILCDQEEYFITDLVEYLAQEGRSVGYIVSNDENEVMGIDDLSALLKAQEIYRQHPQGHPSIP